MKNTLIILLFLLSFAAIAGNKVDKTKEAKAREWLKNQPLEFIENKGQFMRTDGKPADNVLFKTSFGGCDIYITDKGLSYVFVKIEEVGSLKTEVERSEIPRAQRIGDGTKELEDSKLKFGEREKENKKVSYYRLDMNLEGANISKSNIIKENESKQGHYNYFYAHCPEGIYDVKGYGKITIKNIYKGIDWVIYTSSDSKKHPLKYDFVVHPGADYKDVMIKFLNAQSTSLLDKDTKLKIETIAGNIEEGNLFSYVKNEKLKINNEKLEVRSKYVIDKDSIICFEIADYDTTKTLVIDPLVWATYYGSGFSGSICIDSQDNVYFTGSSDNGFPVQQMNGAFWKPLCSNQDLFILKFNSKGVRQWATYYGGTEEEYGATICIDSQNNLFVSGVTFSVNFPTQSLMGAFIQSNNASIGIYYKINGFILRFNNQGVRQWATYYGGNNQDFFNNMTIDQQDNLYIVGHTISYNFPSKQLTGAYWQPLPSSFHGDGFILKFDETGARLWATYYGGTDDYTSFGSVCTDNQDNIYITGYTNSTDFPTQQLPGAYWQSAASGSNTVILKFNKYGVRQWATYYGNGSNYGSTICIDSQENIYLTGIASSLNFPVQQLAGAYWQPYPKGNFDIYILKFNKQGVRQWATFYGGTDSDEGAIIKTDLEDNIIIFGNTYSVDFPIQQLNGEYWQASIPGLNSSFILKFNKQGARQWATYYGGGFSNDGKGIAIDHQNASYFIGYSFDTTLYTNDYGNGAYYDSTGNWDKSIFILKIEPCIQRPKYLEADKNNICFHENENFTLAAIGGKGDFLRWYSDSCGQNYIGENSPILIAVPKQTKTYYARWESD